MMKTLVRLGNMQAAVGFYLHVQQVNGPYDNSKGPDQHVICSWFPMFSILIGPEKAFFNCKVLIFFFFFYFSIKTLVLFRSSCWGTSNDNPCFSGEIKMLSDNTPLDNSVKIWWNLPISNPKPDLHNINAHTKFGEKPLMFTQVIIRKGKTDGCTCVRLMDGWTDTRTSNVKPLYPDTIVWRGIIRKKWGYPFLSEAMIFSSIQWFKNGRRAGECADRSGPSLSQTLPKHAYSNI